VLCVLKQAQKARNTKLNACLFKVGVRRNTDLAHSQSLVDDMVVTCFKSNDIKKFMMDMKNLF
jgi:hypothetical protein